MSMMTPQTNQYNGYQQQNNQQYQQYQQQQQVNPVYYNWQNVCSLAPQFLNECVITGRVPQQFAQMVGARLNAELQSPMSQEQLNATFGNRVAATGELRQWLEGRVRIHVDSIGAAMRGGMGGMNQMNPGMNPFGYPQQQVMQPSPFGMNQMAGMMNGYPQQQMGMYQQAPQYDAYGRLITGNNPYAQGMNNQYNQYNQYNGYARPQTNPYQQAMQPNNTQNLSVYERARLQQQRNQSAAPTPPQNGVQSYNSPTSVATASKPTQPVANKPYVPRVKVTEEEIPETYFEPSFIDDEALMKRIEKTRDERAKKIAVMYAKKVLNKISSSLPNEPNTTERMHAVGIEIENILSEALEVADQAASINGLRDEKFAHVIDSKEAITIDMPYRLAKPKFDAVMEVVKKIPENKTFTDKENHTEVTDYAPRINGVIEALNAIRKQGEQFSRQVEPLIVKEFNDAMRIVFHNEGLYVEDMKNFVDIEDLLTSINDPVMRPWDDEKKFYTAIEHCLNNSLFALFHDGKCYLDPTKMSDASIIANTPVALWVGDSTAREILGSGKELSEDMQKKVTEAVSGVFTVTFKRVYFYTNLDVELDKPIKGALDFDKHSAKKSRYFVFLDTMCKVAGRPLLVINQNVSESKKHPFLMDNAFDGDILIQKFLK